MFRRALLLLALAGFWPLAAAKADQPAEQSGDQPPAKQEPATKELAIQPKPLADSTKKGLAYLVSQQNANGGWGQGGGWRTANQGGRIEGTNIQDPPDVGNTAIATLALIRAGHTPQHGEYANKVAKAVDFMTSKIEKVEQESPYVTDVLGTQLQSKIGQYVDTFLAALVLSELKGKMGNELAEKKVNSALDRAIAKIEKHQKADGTFTGNAGWASVLSQALCSKAINRAAQNGAAVRLEVLDRDSKLAAVGVDLKSKDFSAPTERSVALGGEAASRVAIGRTTTVAAGGIGGGLPAAASGPSDAGVSVYSFSAKAGGLQDALNTARPAAEQARRVLADKKATSDARKDAEKAIDRAQQLEVAADAATNGIVKRLDDKNFIAGFGNNGGEEFLSYMNISETLLAKGGDEWKNWDKSICANLARVQNDDGSWSGHHCITGRTFCTSAALLTILADRAPVPLAAKISEGK
jgi:hypothetical protein